MQTEGTGVIRFRRPAGFIQKAVYDSRGRAATLKNAELTNGRVRYTLDSGGQEIAFEEDEYAVLMSFWVEGVTLTDVQLGEYGDVYYTVKEP